jgi:hypothetical protein
MTSNVSHGPNGEVLTLDAFYGSGNMQCHNFVLYVTFFFFLALVCFWDALQKQELAMSANN